MEDGKWMDNAKRIGVEDQWDKIGFQLAVSSFQLAVFG